MLGGSTTVNNSINVSCSPCIGKYGIKVKKIIIEGKKARKN